MDWVTILLQLGISSVTLYILREYLIRADKRIDERHKEFICFAQMNNHEMTKLIISSNKAIKESTRAIQESIRVIQASSELICKSSKVLEKEV